MSRRHADNWSHPAVTIWHWSPNGHGHEWPTATPFVQCQSALPFWDTAISKFDHENPWSRSCVCGHKSKPRLTFKIQRSRLWSRSNPLFTFEAWNSIDMLAFSFRGNRTTFGWFIGNSIFDLENSRSRSWPRSNLMATFEALGFNRYVCFSIRGNRTIFGWDIANSTFDLENSRSRSWPRSNPMVTFEP